MHVILKQFIYIMKSKSLEYKASVCLTGVETQVGL